MIKQILIKINKDVNKEQKEKLIILFNLRLEELKRKDIEHPRYENMIAISSVIKVMDNILNEQKENKI